MRRLITALATSLLLTSTTHAAAPALATVGAQAPDFTTVDSITGKPLDLKSLRGKIVVLEWNNFGCPFVKAHYESGAMQALQKEQVAAGVVWVSINSSAQGKEGYLAATKEVNAALAEYNAKPSAYVLDHDGKIGRAYGATTTPHMFVIDAKGVLAYAGAIDDKPTAVAADAKTARNYVRDAIAAVKAGKAPDPAKTKAYGCGVKYGY